eukprot:166754-Hanusia_phi.AAC.1
MAPALGRAQCHISPYQQKPLNGISGSRPKSTTIAPSFWKGQIENMWKCIEETTPAHPNEPARLRDIAISTIQKIEIKKEERISRLCEQISHLEAERKEQISRLDKNHTVLVAHLDSTLADQRERKLLADA